METPTTRPESKSENVKTSVIAALGLAICLTAPAVQGVLTVYHAVLPIAPSAQLAQLDAEQDGERYSRARAQAEERDAGGHTEGTYYTHAVDDREWVDYDPDAWRYGWGILRDRQAEDQETLDRLLRAEKSTAPFWGKQHMRGFFAWMWYTRSWTALLVGLLLAIAVCIGTVKLISPVEWLFRMLGILLAPLSPTVAYLRRLAGIVAKI